MVNDYDSWHKQVIKSHSQEFLDFLYQQVNVCLSVPSVFWYWLPKYCRDLQASRWRMFVYSIPWNAEEKKWSTDNSLSDISAAYTICWIPEDRCLNYRLYQSLWWFWWVKIVSRNIFAKGFWCLVLFKSQILLCYWPKFLVFHLMC